MTNHSTLKEIQDANRETLISLLGNDNGLYNEIMTECQDFFIDIIDKYELKKAFEDNDHTNSINKRAKTLTGTDFAQFLLIGTLGMAAADFCTHMFAKQLTHEAKKKAGESND